MVVPSLVIHTVKGFGIVNEAEIDVFLELSCFFDDPVDLYHSQSSRGSLRDEGGARGPP